MGMRQHYLGAAAALALCAFAMPATAAPLSGTTGLRSGTSSAAVEKVNFRRCWWHHGRRVCRWYGHSGGYYPSYGYGYYPFLGFSFGGHRHHGGFRGHRGGFGGHDRRH